MLFPRSSLTQHQDSGHDKFSGFVLKQLASALASNMTIIFNSFIHNNNIVLMTLKIAAVRAVYKQKGSKTDPINYRPISILAILGCTFEKLIATQLY